MTYSDVYTALSACNFPIAQVAWGAPPKDDYLVTRVGGQERALWSDNAMEEQELWCTVDLFVHNSEGLTEAATIQAALNALNIRWELTSVQWESETRINHWEWTFYVKGLL